jgi:Electron transfer DM13
MAALVITVAGFGVYWFAPQALFISTTVNEGAPTVAPVHQSQAPITSTTANTAPVTLARGSFRSLEHQTSGTAILLRLSDGTVILRLENLDTSNGPDVHVTLSPVVSTGGDRDYNNGYLDLGSLKGNKGNQNYDVPAGSDLGRFRSAVIWCKRFTVGFGVAPLA